MKDWDKRQRQDYQSSQGLDSLYGLREDIHSHTENSATQSAQLKPLPRSQKLIDLVTSGSISSEHNTGIPTQMKEDFEAKSGFSFDDVKVHYNSDKPAQLQALAFTHGNQVYVGPGQEKHLLHELGHVVQQKQGIVKPTTQVNGVPVNDDPEMEASADCCGVLGNLPAVQMMEGQRVVQMVRLLDSDKLGENIGERPTKDAQAHHIIPNELVVESIDRNLTNLGITLSGVKDDFDEEWNGIYLPIKSRMNATLPLHGQEYDNKLVPGHPQYTGAVRECIGEENLPNIVIDKEYAKDVAAYFRQIILSMYNQGLSYLDELPLYDEKENME